MSLFLIVSGRDEAFSAHDPAGEEVSKKPGWRIPRIYVDRLGGGGRDLARNALGAADFSYPQIVGGLKIQPRSRITTEISRQPHGRISRNAAPLTNHIIDPWCRNAECLCQRVGAHAKRLQIILPKHLARVNRPHSILKHLRYPQ